MDIQRTNRRRRNFANDINELESSCSLDQGIEVETSLTLDQGNEIAEELSHKKKAGSFKQRPVWNWSEVKAGTMVYLKYYGFWHAVLVTAKRPNCDTVEGIHYAVDRTIFHNRTVKEQEFKVDLKRDELREVDIQKSVRVSPEKAVEMARKLKGEQKFNIFTRRSSHMILECILKK